MTRPSVPPRITALLILLGLGGPLHATTDRCRMGASALSDAKAIAGVRGAIERQCPRATFDGSDAQKTHARYVKCARAVIDDAPSCDGTARVVDASNPNPAFPILGGIAGGYEIVLAEGFAHLDVTTAEDDADNPIPAALVAFLERNVQ